jgi:hypothetical protein
VRTLQSRALRTILAAAVPVGLVLSAAMVWQSTSAAFSATTENGGNSWHTGTVVLSDSDSDSASGAALFDSSSTDQLLAPGVAGARCIRVDYSGDLPADIKLYVTTPSLGATTLDGYLLMSVEQGQDVPDGTPVTPNCSAGFTSTTPAPTFVYDTATEGTSPTLSLLKTHADYATGISVGHGVQQDTHLTFRITYLVEDDNAAQNTRSNANFVWEARDT